MVSLKTILDPSYTVIADNNKYHRCIASSNTLEAFNKAIYHNFGIWIKVLDDTSWNFGFLLKFRQKKLFSEFREEALLAEITMETAVACFGRQWRSSRMPSAISGVGRPCLVAIWATPISC